MTPKRSPLPSLVLVLVSLAAVACGPAPTPEQRARRDSLQALPPMERLPEGPAGDVIRRAIEAHGGWEAWESMGAVDYRKTTIAYYGDGAAADSTVERHRYALHPERKIRIDRVDGEGRSVVLMNDGREAWQLVDGRLERRITGGSPARAPTDGSHYVFSQPFKLTDAGAVFTYLGPDTLPDGTPVEAVRVRYDPGVGRSGGLHTWVYYFDADSHLLAGYRFGEGEEVDEDVFTRHDDHRTVGGLRLFGRRTAYEVAGDGSIRAVRVYRHEDHAVLDSLPDSIFRPVHP